MERIIKIEKIKRNEFNYAQIESNVILIVFDLAKAI